MGGIAAPLPADEAERLRELRSLDVLDTPSEAEFDGIVRAAAEICGTPIALVSLVDAERQWFKSKVGIGAEETPRELAYCAHAILGDSLMEVQDASLDPRFADNPLRTGEPHVNFYAGVPIVMPSGHRLGTLCVIDRVPRKLEDSQREALEALAAQVVRLLELRRARRARPKNVRGDVTARVDLSAPSMPPPTRRTSKRAMTALVVLAIASFLASVEVGRSIDRGVDARLDQGLLRSEQFMSERIAAYTQIVRGTAALFAASESVSRAEFTAYVNSLDLDHHYSGVLGIGFSTSLRPDQFDAFVAQNRVEIPSFHVHESGYEGGPDHSPAVITFIEPMERNARALGFDMASDPGRAAALSRALTTGEVAVSDRLRLLQDPSGGPGFLFLMPTKNVRGDFVGWAFVAVRGRDLVRGIEREAGQHAIVRIQDEADAGPLLGPDAFASNARVTTTNVGVADREFQLGVASGPSFVSPSEQLAPWIVFLLGLAMTGLAFGLVRSMREVEARAETMARQMTGALRRSAIELRNVVDGTSDLIVSFELDGTITLTNRSFRDLLDLPEAVSDRLAFDSLLATHDRGRFKELLGSFGQGKARGTFETRLRSSDGQWIDVEGALEMNPEDPNVIRAIFRDVSIRKHSERALRAANETLERLATIDALTGIANRRRFDERLEEEIGRARRSGAPLAVVMLDVDFFKKFNDRYGHPAGDECLRRVGATLGDLTRRAGELPARYGGEEFALVLPGCDLTGGMVQAERLRVAIEGMGLPHELNPAGVVTASFGVASLDDVEVKDRASLLAAADAALYRAKADGRNRVRGGAAPVAG